VLAAGGGAGAKTSGRGLLSKVALLTALTNISLKPTYNPLGSFLTFLNEDDIVKAVLEVARAYDDERG
jgi:hypothetical protein